MNKNHLLKYIHATYANVAQAVAEMNAVQLSQPGAADEWSVNDIIAHLAYWQQQEADHLKEAHGDSVERYAPQGMDVDSMNRIIFAQNRGRDWLDILEDFRQSFLDIVAEIERLSHEDLAETQRYAWTEGEPLWKSIAGETYEHANEHLTAIRQWIRTVKGTPWPQA